MLTTSHFRTIAPLLCRRTYAQLAQGHARPSLSSLPIVLKPSPQELSANRLTWKNLQIATRAIHRDGLVVIEDIVEHPTLDALNEKMIHDCAILTSRGEKSPYNYNKGNIQQGPPPIKHFFSPQIFFNPLVTQISTSILGPRPRLNFVSGNTAVPPAEDSEPQSQPVHSDADFDHPACPFALVINVPLVSMTPENGSTEIWLGTHTNAKLDAQEGQHGDRASGKIKQNLLEERARVRPPTQPHVKKGSIIVRDLRLWHAGKPNYTQNARVMLAMIHFAQWYQNPMTVELSEDLRPVVEGVASELQVPAVYLPEADIAQTYLNRPFGNAYDFNQRERLEDLF